MYIYLCMEACANAGYLCLFILTGRNWWIEVKEINSYKTETLNSTFLGPKHGCTTQDMCVKAFTVVGLAIVINYSCRESPPIIHQTKAPYCRRLCVLGLLPPLPGPISMLCNSKLSAISSFPYPPPPPISNGSFAGIGGAATLCL
jgi:hypothetical protein